MGPRPWYGPGHHVHEGLGWGGWTLWVLFMVALWALVIMAAVWFARGLRGRTATPVMTAPAAWRGSGPATVSAEQILAERFAHGQIDENEYRSRLAVLRGGQATAAAAGPAAPPQPPTPPPPPPPTSTE